MPNSFESTSDSDSASDLTTTSTVLPYPIVHVTSQSNTTSCDVKPEPPSGFESSNFAQTNSVYIPLAAPASQVRWQSHQEPSPGMPTQLNNLGPQPVATMSEKEREDYIKREASIRRTEWYNGQFDYKSDQKTAAAEKIMSEAPVIAELRTNVIIKDEFTLITDLSSELSNRYHRPETSIMIVLSHSSCLLIGGSFDPAYILTITTLPEYVQQATNQRNSFLIQRLMSKIIGVPADRGIIRFVAIAEAMLGTKGTTVLGQMKEKEPGLARALTSQSSNRKSLADRRKSLTSPIEFARMASTRSVKSTKERGMISDPIPEKSTYLDPNSSFTRAGATSPRSRPTSSTGSNSGFGLSIVGGRPNSASPPMPENRPTSAKKSILKMTGQSEVVVPPPPVPANAKSNRMNKRKSIISIFKRDKTS